MAIAVSGTERGIDITTDDLEPFDVFAFEPLEGGEPIAEDFIYIFFHRYTNEHGEEILVVGETDRDFDDDVRMCIHIVFNEYEDEGEPIRVIGTVREFYWS